MLFHIEFIPRENWGPADSLAMRKLAVEFITTIVQSGKVKESGLYADERGGFFIIDINSPEELILLLAPVLDVISVTSHPIVSVETLQKLMAQ